MEVKIKIFIQILHAPPDHGFEASLPALTIP